MPIRKLNDYKDRSYFDDTIEPISEAGNALALSKITENNDHLPLWNGAAWPGGSSGGNATNNLMVEYIVPSTCQDFTISNLDSNSWGGMVIELMLVRAVTDQIGIDMYINSDETYSKYAFKLITFGTTGGSPTVYGSSGTFGSAQVYTDGNSGASIGTIGGAMIDILHLNNTVGVISRQILSPIGYYQMGEVKYVNSANINNITSLKFKSYAAGNIGAGTRVRIYSKKSNILTPTNQQLSTNISSTYTVSSATDTIDIPNLNSILDGGYEVELQSYNAASGDIYCFVNEDLTPSNYYSEGILGYRTTVAVSGVVNYPVIAGADSGTYTRSRINLNIDSFGYMRGDAITYRDYSNAHASLWAFKKTATTSAISSITLKHTASGGFGVGTTVTVRKRNINIPQEITQRVIDLTNTSVDYTLQVGQTAILTYTNATSVPLHVSTVEGLYELDIIGDRTTSITNNNGSYLMPNNLSQSSYISIIYENGAGPSRLSSTTSTNFQLGEGRINMASFKLNTFTISKASSGLSQASLTSGNVMSQVLHNYLNDTTTPWTSLGTITFPFNQSGKIIIKRII
jgi:hypothetical protein